jgi:hypothetical protein
VCGRFWRWRLARRALTSPAAAAIFAQDYAIEFLGRPATSAEKHTDVLAPRRNSAAPAMIAGRILASQAFFDFVNSALGPR